MQNLIHLKGVSMKKSYRCDICKKDIQKGNVCDDCSAQIGGFIKSIKESLREAKEKNSKKPV